MCETILVISVELKPALTSDLRHQRIFMIITIDLQIKALRTRVFFWLIFAV